MGYHKDSVLTLKLQYITPIYHTPIEREDITVVPTRMIY